MPESRLLKTEPALPPRSYKNAIWIFPIIVGILFVWYLVSSSLFRKAPTETEVPSQKIEDALSTMDTKTKERFYRAVALAEQKTSLFRSEIPPEGASAVAKGDFAIYAEEVKGEALLMKNNERTIIRLANFETANGPNLHVYLVAGLNNKNVVDLGALHGTKGNMNYPVSSLLDTSAYRYVLIWDKDFNVLFGWAELKLLP